MFQSGKYWGKIKDAVYTKGEKSSAIAIVIDVTHQAGANGWEAIPPQERTIFLYDTEKAWPYTEEKLVNLGFNGDFASMKFDPKFSDEGLGVECEVEEYQGKTREKWNLSRLGGLNLERADDATIRTMNAKWKAKHGGAKAAPAKPAAPATPARSTAPAKPQTHAVAPDTIKDKDGAWTFVEEQHNGKKSADEIADLFYKAVAAHEKKLGKPEDQFDAATWRSVADDASLPF